LRRDAYIHFRNLLLGNAAEEVARLAEPAPLGWWGSANIMFTLSAGSMKKQLRKNPQVRRK
jgi:hypothetical protein